MINLNISNISCVNVKVRIRSYSDIQGDYVTCHRTHKPINCLWLDITWYAFLMVRLCMHMYNGLQHIFKYFYAKQTQTWCYYQFWPLFPIVFMLFLILFVVFSIECQCQATSINTLTFYLTLTFCLTFLLTFWLTSMSNNIINSSKNMTKHHDD